MIGIRMNPPAALRRLPSIAWLLILFLLIALLPLFFSSPYILGLVVLAMTYTVMAEGWNLIGGYGGEVSLGHVAFFGIGMYTTGLISLSQLGLPYGVDIVLGGICAAALAAAIGYPFLRLRGPYFAMGTLVFAQILYVVIINSKEFKGAAGIIVPFLKPYSVIPYYYTILVIVVVSLLIIYRLVNSKFGLALEAIRDDIEAAMMLGINATRYKMMAFVLSALFTGIAGSFFANYVSYFNPNVAFSQATTFEIVLMATVGGAGTFVGPMIGVPIVMALQEIGRQYILQGYILLLAVFFVLMSLFSPGGIVGAISRKTPVLNPLRLLKKNPNGKGEA
jgi:branched-chain amino acid transport system permease protein